MNIFSTATANFQEAYNILCAPVKNGDLYPVLSPTLCKVPVGGASKLHRHFEDELFLILKGEGVLSINDESTVVGSGDLIPIPSGSVHQLRNTSEDAMEFLSVYGEDFAVKAPPKNVLITTAPPTPNGPLHLGHISGPYLAADVLARSLRQSGSDVLVHSGTDDEQNYVAVRARALGLETPTFRRLMRSRILQGLNNLSIEYDEFAEPAIDTKFSEATQALFLRGLEAGVLREASVRFPYCEGCEQWLYDGTLSGMCPACGAASSGGCESCGIVVPAYQVQEPHCSCCQTRATLKQASVVEFNVGEYLPLVAEELNALDLPLRLRELIAKVKAMASTAVMIADPAGVPHVWFQMAAHYEQFATAERVWIHSFGFDNSFYYLLFIPSLLKALNPLAKLPAQVITNEFLHLDGLKFSTSRNHAIWADEFVGDADHLRLYLCLNRPSVRSENFVLQDFEAFSARLEQQFALLLQLTKIHPTVLEVGGEASLQIHRFERDMASSLSVERFNLRQAGLRILSFLDWILQSSLNTSEVANATAVLAKASSPILPRLSKEVLRGI